jgi:hypothetical protein
VPDHVPDGQEVIVYEQVIDVHPIWEHQPFLMQRAAELHPAPFPLTRYQDQAYVDNLEPNVALDGADLPLGLHFALKRGDRPKLVLDRGDYDPIAQTSFRYEEPAAITPGTIQACSTWSGTEPYWTEAWNDTQEDGTLKKDWGGWVQDYNDIEPD